MTKKYIILLATCLALVACQELPQLDNFDNSLWKNDKMGCKNDRKQLLASLKENKSKLMGLSQTQIIKLLGKPDKQKLYQRNQKFYLYYVNSQECTNRTDTTLSLVSVRFSAIDNVTEVIIE